MVHALAFLKKNTHFSYFFRLTQGPCSYIYTLKARQWSGSHKGPQPASLFLNGPWLLYALSLCFCFLVVGLFSCSCQHTTCLQYSFLLPYQLPFPIHNRPGVSVSYCCVTNHLKKHSGFKQQAIYCCSCVYVLAASVGTNDLPLVYVCWVDSSVILTELSHMFGFCWLRMTLTK